MSCHAIKLVPESRWNTCRNYPMDGSLFCSSHQYLTREEHKDIWISKYILAADGDPFLYQYDTHKMNRILGDLRDGIITLTQEDILRITNRQKYIDTYILLFENGYINLTDKRHDGMYKKSLEYLADFWVVSQGNLWMPLPLLAQKIKDVLILKDATHFLEFLKVLPSVMKKAPFQGNNLANRMVSVTAFLTSLLDSDAACSLSWRSIQKDLTDHYNSELPNHPLQQFIQNVYLPHIRQIYAAQKQAQRVRADTYKEELMAFTWHPDRFIIWCLDEEEKVEHEEMVG